MVRNRSADVNHSAACWGETKMAFTNRTFCCIWVEIVFHRGVWYLASKCQSGEHNERVPSVNKPFIIQCAAHPNVPNEWNPNSSPRVTRRKKNDSGGGGSLISGQRIHQFNTVTSPQAAQLKTGDTGCSEFTNKRRHYAAESLREIYSFSETRREWFHYQSSSSRLTKHCNRRDGW